MAGSQVTPKTWTSPRDLAHVPPPQTVKLSRFLNISIYSAVSWLFLFPCFFPGERGRGEMLEKILGMSAGGKTDSRLTLAF